MTGSGLQSAAGFRLSQPQEPRDRLPFCLGIERGIQKFAGAQPQAGQ